MNKKIDLPGRRLAGRDDGVRSKEARWRRGQRTVAVESEERGSKRREIERSKGGKNGFCSDILLVLYIYKCMEREYKDY